MKENVEQTEKKLIKLSQLVDKSYVLLQALIKNSDNLNELSDFSGENYKRYRCQLDVVMMGETEKKEYHDALTEVKNYQKKMLKIYSEKLQKDPNNIQFLFCQLTTLLLDTCFNMPNLILIMCSNGEVLLEKPRKLIDQIVQLKIENKISQEEYNKVLDAVSPLFGLDELSFFFDFVDDYEEEKVISDSIVLNTIMTNKVKSDLTKERSEFLRAVRKDAKNRISLQNQESRELLERTPESFVDNVSYLVAINQFDQKIKKTHLFLSDDALRSNLIDLIEKRKIIKNTIENFLLSIEKIEDVEALKNCKNELEKSLNILDGQDKKFEKNLLEASEMVFNKLSLLDMVTSEKFIDSYENKINEINSQIKIIELTDKEHNEKYHKDKVILEKKLTIAEESLYLYEKQKKSVKHVEAHKKYSYDTMSMRYDLGWFGTASWLGGELYHDSESITDEKLYEVAQVLGLPSHSENESKNTYKYNYNKLKGYFDKDAMPYRTAQAFVEGYKAARDAYHAKKEGTMPIKEADAILMQHASQTESVVKAIEDSHYNLDKYIESLRNHYKDIKKKCSVLDKKYESESKKLLEQKMNLLKQKSQLENALTEPKKAYEHMKKQHEGRQQINVLIKQHREKCETAYLMFKQGLLRHSEKNENNVFIQLNQQLLELAKEYFDSLAKKYDGITHDVSVNIDNTISRLHNETSTAINDSLLQLISRMQDLVELNKSYPAFAQQIGLLLSLWNGVLVLLQTIGSFLGASKATSSANEGGQRTTAYGGSVFFQVLENKKYVSQEMQDLRELEEDIQKINPVKTK